MKLLGHSECQRAEKVMDKAQVSKGSLLVAEAGSELAWGAMNAGIGRAVIDG